MKQHSTYCRTILFLLILSQRAYASSEISTFDAVIDTTVSCVHWIFCPYCLIDSNRLLQKYQDSLDKNDIKTIAHIIRRRGFGANQQLLDGALPLIYAAKKAHVESVEQLLKLGSDANSQLKGNQFESYPSALIAVCISEKNSPERVAQTVKTLLAYGADPSRTVVMLTETEKIEFEKLRKEFEENPSKEYQILARMPKEWFQPRTALDFALKHKYLDAANMIRQAIIGQRKKGSQKNEQTDEPADDY